jgi:segregation and condensation protein B
MAALVTIRVGPLSSSPTMSSEEKPPTEPNPLSLSRLRAAFAQMLGASPPEAKRADTGTKQNKNKQVTSPQPSVPAPDPCEISPRTVVEAMLFVGRPDGDAFTSREMAAAMRGVSPAEIDTAVAELNARYERDASPYEITGTAAGYRLALRSELHRMRDKLHGRVREAKLTPTAIEVLSIVAYNQPTTVEAVSTLRGAPSGGVLSSLVRRKLVCIDRGTDRNDPPQYATTDRFLRLFNLESIAALPRNEELEKL